MQATIEQKIALLARILKQFDKLAVALSGGVDSAVLLAKAHDVLGDRVIAVTARSPIHPQQDIADAVRLCSDLGVRHWIVDSKEMGHAEFLANPPQRCYICKQIVFGQLIQKIGGLEVAHLAHGANADDLGDYRPGLRAAQELHIAAPLMEAGLTKSEIRSIARQRGMDVWNKPAMACLATRIPYGRPITVAVLQQIRQAETVLGEAGLSGYRLRHHGRIARIEVPMRQLSAIVSDPMRQHIVDRLRHIGFDHVCMDLEGYTTGSMNRALKTDERQA